MVVGYHLIWTLYGWWLPNDPRGSMSREILVEQIADLGEHHYGRKTVQPLPAELRAFYDRARAVLKHQLLRLTDDDIQIVGKAIGEAIKAAGYTCYSCAIMPDHIHALIRRHRDKAEVMIERLQNASWEALIAAQRRPAEHPVWGGPGWKVFLNTHTDMERIDRYVRQNPIKARRPAQRWSFVTQYDGWLPRPAKG
jgi:REP element-mobilizing transposase RayT